MHKKVMRDTVAATAGLWLAGLVTAHAALVAAGGLGIANEPGKKFGAAAMIYYAGPEWETGYLNEGVNQGTDGVFAQYRLTRAITHRLRVAMALGPEVLNTTHDISPGVRTNGYHASLLVSLSTSYRVTKHWRVGLRWNHVTFQQSATFGYRDADMVLLTVGYGQKIQK
ncbi:MAG: hypothetical protein ACYDEV_16740 [Acidiferrobacter sp.]